MPMTYNQRLERWTHGAISDEIVKLGNLPEENINKPGSEFYKCLVRIASIVRGAGRPFMEPARALALIEIAVEIYPSITKKEIYRQWRNAWKFAEPRVPAWSEVQQVAEGEPEELPMPSYHWTRPKGGNNEDCPF